MLGQIVRLALVAILQGFRGMQLDWLDLPFGLGANQSWSTIAFVAGLASLAMLRPLAILGQAGRPKVPFYSVYALALLLLFMLALLRVIMFGDAEDVVQASLIMFRFVVDLVIIHCSYVAFSTLRELRSLLVGTILGCLAIVVVFAQKSLEEGGLVWRFGLADNPNTITYVLAMGFWAAIGPLGLLGDASRTRKVALVALATTFVVVLIMTGSRGGSLALALLSAFALAISAARAKWLHSAVLLCSAPAIVAVMSIVMSDSLAVQRITHPFEVEESLTGVDPRGSLAGITIEGMLESPQSILVGAGLGSFRLEVGASDKVVVYTYPHNLLLDVTYNAGLLAALVMLALLLHCSKILYDILRRTRQLAHVNNLTVGITGFWAIVVVSSMFSFDFTTNILLWLLIGAIASVRELATAEIALLPPGTRRTPMSVVPRFDEASPPVNRTDGDTSRGVTLRPPRMTR